ncbi:MAG: porphobilinogen synthase [Candidatus Eremiobacteraeota bacterium]|nr:porphobilinogen synthase [Candidatus Eremiobacteraeota bacterium]MCW5869154.1 porphobilinogen synthase [Candidatus Eremiobacteraeota bacterium]
MRRLRGSAELRALVRETQLTPNDFCYPLFVVEGENVVQPIQALPGQHRWSVDKVVGEVEAALAEGIRSVILFGLPAGKDAEGSQAYADNAPVQRAVRELKRAFPQLVVMTDVCLCQYTDHGHCGPLRGDTVDNDAALQILAQTAVSHARAGADLVAPSDMMDGRVGAIRAALDAAGFQPTGILSYAVKFASAYYGPFREAADSKPSFGDRRSYQMDSANRREALREAALDLQEGADWLMVKPALAYLDILRDLREHFALPLACYNVSGEYSMIKAAAANGWLDEKLATLETLLSMKRAGADLILTYHAREAARWLV